jgi:hypothetical protein
MVYIEKDVFLQMLLGIFKYLFVLGIEEILEEQMAVE